MSLPPHLPCPVCGWDQRFSPTHPAELCETCSTIWAGSDLYSRSRDEVTKTTRPGGFTGTYPRMASVREEAPNVVVGPNLPRWQDHRQEIDHEPVSHPGPSSGGLSGAQGKKLATWGAILVTVLTVMATTCSIMGQGISYRQMRALEGIRERCEVGVHR